MKGRRQLIVGALLVLAAARLAPPARSIVPEALTDDQFWTLSDELSEPGGTFRSDNLLSNERQMQYVIPTLVRTVKPGSAYVGVGPEQNFTYIAAIRPAIAFIVDIRRGNLQLHLMYKAVFELSANRSEFVARLFSRTSAEGLLPSATAAELFTAYTGGEPDDARLADNVAALREHLTRTRKLPLNADDLQGIVSIYTSFGTLGPLIQYSANFGGTANFPTYADLMSATDGAGTPRSFLATEEAFRSVKGLHERNLIVPVVGDFAGPKALRSVGRYLRDRQAVVGAFYLSNVEQYLGREGRLAIFCENAAALPLDDRSSFIRSVRDVAYGRGIGLTSTTASMRLETRECSR